VDSVNPEIPTDAQVYVELSESLNMEFLTPTVTPSLSNAGPTPTVTPTPSPTVGASPTPTPAVSATPAVTGTPLVTISPTPSPTTNASPTPTPVVTGTPAVTVTPVVTSTPASTPAVTPTITPSPSYDHFLALPAMTTKSSFADHPAIPTVTLHMDGDGDYRIEAAFQGVTDLGSWYEPEGGTVGSLWQVKLDFVQSTGNNSTNLTSGNLGFWQTIGTGSSAKTWSWDDQSLSNQVSTWEGTLSIRDVATQTVQATSTVIITTKHNVS